MKWWRRDGLLESRSRADETVREMERDERQSGVAGKELGAPSLIKLGHDVESADA